VIHRCQIRPEARDDLRDAIRHYRAVQPTCGRVLRGRATISLETPGARVWVVSDGEEHALPFLPLAVDIDTSRSWSIRATKKGYRDYEQAIDFDDGSAERRFTVILSPIKPVLTPAR
jgi:hypothetical protein